jgi:hypothetical protein
VVTYALTRRNFLAGLGGAVGLASFLGKLEQLEAAGPPSIKRFLSIQRPVGTEYDDWWPSGSGTNFTLSRVLQHFEPLRNNMVIFRSLKLPWEGSTGGGHERGTVLMATGVRTVALYPGNGGDDPYAEGPSVDQLFVKQATALQGAPIESLQLSCDSRADTPEVSTRHMSYSAARTPMRPYYQPLEAYQRVFGTLMPGGNGDELAVARAQKRSVLDFSRRDLARMRTLAPASGRETLDAWEAAIVELEGELDADPSDPVSCGVASPPPEIDVNTRLAPYDPNFVTAERDDERHDQIGQLHMAIIKAAFRCDLTRVVTFQWSPGTNHVSFGDLWPPDPSLFKGHHPVSHDGGLPEVTEFMTRVEEWYATRNAAFIADLNQTADPITGTGTILDTTLVPYITEVGNRDHRWEPMPFLLFGGAGTGLIGNQFLQEQRMRSTNDFWMALAGYYGLPDFVLGDSDQHTTALTGLFA